MVTNDKVARLLRKEFGGAAPGEAIVPLIINLTPMVLLAVLLFAFTRDQGTAYAAALAGGAFGAMVVLGYFLGAACGDQVGIADEHYRRAMRDSQSFFRRDHVDDHLAAGMGLIVVQFFCGGLHKAIVMLRRGSSQGPLGEKHFKVAVGIMKAVLDNNQVAREQLIQGVTAADPRLSAQEVEKIITVLTERKLLCAAGDQLAVPPEKVHAFYS